MVHFTSSDVNQEHQIRRTLKRAGITMPAEPRNVAGKPTPRTKAAVRAALVKLGDPDPVRIKDVLANLPEPVTSGAVTNVLVSMGYHPSGSRQSRRYHRPNMISLLPQPVVAPPVQTQPMQTPDFLDLVGSRMIDPATFPDHLTIGDVRAMLAALGMGMQIRVWSEPAEQSAADPAPQNVQPARGTVTPIR